jgi:hypothetical protein
MRHHLLAIALGVATLTIVGPASASAQDETPALDPTCALVSVDELSGIFGEAATAPAGGDDQCTWTLGEKVVQITVISGDGIDPDARIDAIRTAFEETKDLDVSGLRAFFTLDQFRQLYVETADGGTITVATSGFPDGVDLEGPEVAVASLVIARLGTAEALPTAAPSSPPQAPASASPAS